MSKAGSVKWSDVVADSPELAQVVKQILVSHPHHVIATTKLDGSPRVGGTNVFFTDDDMWIGSMPAARRNDDLRRDPRCALHSAPLDEHLEVGDVRLDLVAEEASSSEAAALLRSTGHEGAGVVFVLRFARLSLVRVEKDDLIIETWDPIIGSRTARLS